VAVAAAESDPLLYTAGVPYAAYGTYGYAGIPYHSAYTYGTYPAALGYSAYASPFYGRLFKREAEAEADPLFYNAALPYAAYNPYTAYSAYTPYAHAFYGNPTLVQASAGAASSVSAAPRHFPGAFGGYAAAGKYVARSGNTVHIAKREAEAESNPLYYSAYGALPYYGSYAAARPYAYGFPSTYGLGYRAYTPYGLYY